MARILQGSCQTICLVQRQIPGTTLHLLNQSPRMGPRNLNFEPTLQVILMHTKIRDPPWKGLNVQGSTHRMAKIQYHLLVTGPP